MTIKEIKQQISFYENRAFGLKVMINSSYPVKNYFDLIQKRDEIKEEICKLEKILSLKKERKEKLKKIINNED